MEADLKALELKLTQFVQLCQQLRVDNQQLRQQLASAITDNKQLAEKIGTAMNDNNQPTDKISTPTSRLENLLNQIPEEEA